jgi:hypothetical protein
MAVQELTAPDAARQRRIDEVPDEPDDVGDINRPAAPS